MTIDSSQSDTALAARVPALIPAVPRILRVLALGNHPAFAPISGRVTFRASIFYISFHLAIVIIRSAILLHLYYLEDINRVCCNVPP